MLPEKIYIIIARVTEEQYEIIWIQTVLTKMELPFVLYLQCALPRHTLSPYLLICSPFAFLYSAHHSLI